MQECKQVFRSFISPSPGNCYILRNRTDSTTAVHLQAKDFMAKRGFEEEEGSELVQQLQEYKVGAGVFAAPVASKGEVMVWWKAIGDQAPVLTDMAVALYDLVLHAAAIGDSNLATAWQSFAHDLVNAAVPHLVEQQHVEWPFLSDLDGPDYQGLQSLHERKSSLERPGKKFSWC